MLCLREVVLCGKLLEGGGTGRSAECALLCLACPGWLVGLPLATGQADGQILVLGRAAAVGFGAPDSLFLSDDSSRFAAMEPAGVA